MRVDRASLAHGAKHVSAQVDLNVDAETSDDEDDDEAPAVSEDVAEVGGIGSDPTPARADGSIVALEESDGG